MPPTKKDSQMKTDTENTNDVTGADSLDRPVGLIETAPRDGTYILVWTGHYWEFALYDRGAWCGAHHSSTHGNELYNPTHWMPQPPPPNTKVRDRHHQGGNENTESADGGGSLD